MADALRLLAEGTNTGPSTRNMPGVSSTITSIVLRALLIILVVLIVLVFIHFTIRPIFKSSPDDPGIIPTPSMIYDDKVFWQTKKDLVPLDVGETPIGTSVGNYSFTLDIEIDDVNNSTNLPRILFFKGTDFNKIPPSHAEQATVASMILNPSIIFALTRDTNDLQVSVITENNNLEGVLLLNVPLRKPFRVGVIISNKRLEVYTNGLLSRTRALSGPLKAVGGKFWPSSVPGVQLRNLHIWPSTITPGQMRAALPALNGSSFDVTSLQGSLSCPSLLEDSASSMFSSLSGGFSSAAAAVSNEVHTAANEVASRLANGTGETKQ